MPTPEYVTGLREKIGTDLLWMPGASAYVLRDGPNGPQVLLVRRSDNAGWTPITGICDPGEEPPGVLRFQCQTALMLSRDPRDPFPAK